MPSLLRVFAVLAVAAVLAAPPALANVLFPDPIGSLPSDSENNVLREAGRKGLLYKFNYTDDAFNPIAGGFPLNLATVSVRINISGSPPLACTAGVSPPPGQCSFRNVEGETPDGQLDFIEILYNGDFPASTQVVYGVTGAVSAMGEAQDLGSPPNVTFTTGNLAPRPLASLELVVDISGSMGSPAAPGGAVSRLDAVKQAAQVLFQMLGDYALVGDKLGAVYFSTDASVFDGVTPGGTNLEPAHDPAAVGAIQADLNVRLPTSLTSIGDGLALANSGGFTADPVPNPSRHVLLFSDGEQNQPLDVAVVGNVLQVGGSAYPADIRVCPITAGRQTAPGFALQQAIATARCDGHNAHVQDGATTFVQGDLTTFFTQALSDVLVGDKLELVRNQSGRLDRGATVTERFLANPEDVALSLVLAWSGEVRRLAFELVAPDGTAVDLRGRTQFGNHQSFTTLPLPFIQGGTAHDPAGEWQVRLLGNNFEVDGLDYHLLVLLDNRSLASRFTVASDDPGTGEDIPIRVILQEGGAPVAGATVTARLVGPEAGTGDILATAPNPGTGSVPDGGINAAAQAKLAALLADPQFADLFAEEALPDLVLSDDGDAASGDEAAGDGVYSALFRTAQEEGHYHFAVDVRGDAPTNGAYQRSRRLSVFVRPKPDPARTELVAVSVVALPAGGLQVHLRATPRDALGNFLGPGYLGQLDLRITAGSVVTPLQDRLDGSYEVTYDVPPGSDPDVVLEVLEDTVIETPLNDLEDLSDSGLLGGGWRLSLHAGVTSPHGALGSVADGAWSAGVDAEFPLRGAFSAEVYLGHDRFDANLGSDPAFTMVTGRARWTFGSGAVRPSVFVGAGPFLDRDSDLFLGLEGGVAVQWWLDPDWALEGGYVYRSVDGGDFEYGLLQAGARIRF